MNADDTASLVRGVAAGTASGLRRAFFRDVATIRGSASANGLLAALEAGNAYGAARCVDLALYAEPFPELRDMMTQAAITAGHQCSAGVGVELSPPIAKGGLVLHKRGLLFNPLAERFARTVAAWIEATAGRLMGEASTVAAYVIARGMEGGRLASSIAAEVLASIGLRERQRDAAGALRRAMEAMDREGMIRAAREGRLDEVAARAARAERPLSQAQVDARVLDLNRKALAARGLVLGGDLAAAAAHLGLHRSWEQAVEDGIVDGSRVLKRWVHLDDAKVRPSHQGIPLVAPDGVPFLQPFRTPDGQTIMHPHDPAAPPSLVVNCRCVATYEAS